LLASLSLLLLFAIAPEPVAAQASSFYTVAPCRLLDTRDPGGPFGGPSLSFNASRSFTFAGRCGISTDATAISANLTITAPSTAGFVTAYPASTVRPVTSQLNYRAGQTRTNNAILALGPGGGVEIYLGQASGAAHLIVDVNGYFVDSAVAAGTTAAPAFLPPPGTYSGAQSIQIISSTPGATIRFTTDGTLPTRTVGQVYSSPVALGTPATVRAIAYLDGLADSAPVSGFYNLLDQPTLFLATLAPEGGSISAGTGTSTLLLSADALSARVQFSFSNLTTPRTAGHIHGPADPGTSGPILFDLDTAPAQPDGSRIWVFAPSGATTVAQIVQALRSGRLYINIHSSRYPNGEIRGHYRLAAGSQVFVPPLPPPSLPPGPPTARDAARFLTQATYGPRFEDITDVQTRGYNTWLNDQFDDPTGVSHLAYLDAAAAAGEDVYSNQVMESFWEQALTRHDQLRQRTALALSEIFVVSDASGALENQPYGVAGYLDVLEHDAFGNFRQLMEDVTLSPAMGEFLNMRGNDREDPETMRNPNENYAREILQLFSIGLYQLNPDGTLALDGQVQPIPTYDQPVVEGFAHVFTGWNFAGNPLDDDGWFWPNEDWRESMQAWPDHHSLGTKLLLDGQTLPPGQSPEDDLRDALDAIFTHPNVGPFLCRQLMQRLVTSNPSPGYVYRCAQAFADNGSGVRGDMKAVLRAILLDYEARAETVTTQQGFGKQKEPIVRLGQILRAFRATAPSGKFRIWNLESPDYGLGQNPLRAPTVFNFFEPNYVLPGATADAGLVAPEFKITTETTAIGNANFFRDTVYRGVSYDLDQVSPDYSEILPLAGNPTQLIDRLNLLLMSNGMSSTMRSILIQAITEIPPSETEERTMAAVHLIATSPEFVIQK
jgi:uncharacterized protein (DUF1800 family)